MYKFNSHHNFIRKGEHGNPLKELIQWLLVGPPWVVYGARKDLLGQREDAPEVKAASQAMVQHSLIRGLIAELSSWPGPILKTHKSAGHLLHKLVFLADLGLRGNDPGMETIIRQILAHRSPEGPYQIKVNINRRYGGQGVDQLVWMLCDAPLVLYSLVKFGYRDSPDVQGAIHYLLNLIRDHGWPCAVTAELGKFRGPGRKTDPCPYATLVMLKLLTELPENAGVQEAIENGSETLLYLWEQRREQRPYLFAMGSGFEKLKAPLVWYDLVHVTEVLSRIPRICSDPRFQEMVAILRQKADKNGKYTPESVWRDWKKWCFGQKKEPSPYLTLLIQRILWRLDLRTQYGKA